MLFMPHDNITLIPRAGLLHYTCKPELPGMNRQEKWAWLGSCYFFFPTVEINISFITIQSAIHLYPIVHVTKSNPLHSNLSKKKKKKEHVKKKGIFIVLIIAGGSCYFLLLIKFLWTPLIHLKGYSAMELDLHWMLILPRRIDGVKITFYMTNTFLLRSYHDNETAGLCD